MIVNFGWKQVLTASGVVAAVLLVPAVMAKGPLQEKEDDEADQAKTAFSVKPKASISPVQAMKIAEKSSGGKAFQATFEFDEGHWVYGVMVKKGTMLMEVELNPVTGKIGETEKVTPDGEAKEVRSDLAKILKG